MTKRILALVLVCILAIPIFALPAYADTTDWNYDTDIFLGVIGIESILESIQSWFNTLFGSDWQSNTNTWWYSIHHVSSRIYQTLQGIDAVIKDECGKIAQKIGDFRTSVGNYFADLKASITSDFEFLTDNLSGWIDKQTNAIVSVINTIIHGNEDKQPEIDKIQDDMSQKETEYQDSMDIIQEATRPDYEDLDLSLEGITDKVYYLFTSEDYFGMIRMIIEETILYDFTFLALVFSLISFVIFGKR